MPIKTSFLPPAVEAVLNRHEAFFEGASPLRVARAPGRLDVMGGIADYSGSVVLEMPLAEAAYAFLQPRADGRLRIRSASMDSGEAEAILEFETAAGEAGNLGSPEAAAAYFRERPGERWAGYLAGCWPVLSEARPGIDLSGGAGLLLVSEVPSGAGVSSSAAIEVATLRALASVYGIEMEGMELARLCQRVENVVVGAPCGIMDQVTSALGREGELLALKCQPHDLLGYHRLPPGYAVTGLDSGVKHSVGGSQYTKARVAAFMGHRIITAEREKDFLNGYLANLSPEEYTSQFRQLLPKEMSGHEFIKKYRTTIDPVTQVKPEEIYPIRSCVEHPIGENARVQGFIEELTIIWECIEETGGGEEVKEWIEAAIDEAGRLMYSSHVSYGENCGLGSEETDFIVKEVRDRGPERGLYGAKITGGGSGGTVAVLMRDTPDAEAALEEVRAAYEAEYGFRPRRFVGSSPGAMEWEPQVLNRQE